MRNEGNNMLRMKWRKIINTLSNNTFFRNYGAWIPAILIAVAIFSFSHQPAEESTNTSESFSRVILFLASKIKIIDMNQINLEEMFQKMAVPVRKSAHAIEFATLDLTLLFALYFRGLRGGEWLKTAFLMTVLYACSDEIHQLFIPGRAGLVTDVLVDTTGVLVATAGIGLLIMIFKKLKKKNGEFNLACFKR